MFKGKKKKIEELDLIKRYILDLKLGQDELVNKHNDFQDQIASKLSEIDVIKKYVDDRLTLHYKEFADRYFQALVTLSNFIRQSAPEVDIDKLKAQLMKPFTEHQRLKAHNEEADRIDRTLATKGELYRKEITELHDRILVLERTGKGEKSLPEMRMRKQILEELLK